MTMTIEVISMYPPSYRGNERGEYPGVWGVAKCGLACETVLSESPVSIREAFPRLGAKHNRPQKFSSLGQAANDLAACSIGTMGLPSVWLSIRAGSMIRQCTSQVNRCVASEDVLYMPGCMGLSGGHSAQWDCHSAARKEFARFCKRLIYLST